MSISCVLTFRDIRGRNDSVIFHMKTIQTMGYIFRVLEIREGDTIRVTNGTFKGKPVSNDDTPETLGMESTENYYDNEVLLETTRGRHPENVAYFRMCDKKPRKRLTR